MTVGPRMGTRALAVLCALAVAYAAGCGSPSSTTEHRSPPIATPVPTSSAKTVTVGSIPALLNTLVDNSVDAIVVTDGTYHVSAASDQVADSLWIGSRFAARTRPITVRAATVGGVTFDGGGTGYFGCISFEDGAHDQTWDGFTCANGGATSTGVVTFGGYPSLPGAPHHITLRHFTIASSCTGSATSASSPATDHAFYISNAASGGPHDLLFEDITVDGTGGLASAFHFYHSATDAPNASDVTIRRLHVKGTQQAIILWDSTLRNITFEAVDVTNDLKFAVRYETTGSTGIVFANITSTGSGTQGFYSSQGDSPVGVTLTANSFR